MSRIAGVIAALIAFSIASDADARRMGGGRSIGKQREAISPRQAAPRAPAQQPQQAAPAREPQAAPASPPAQQPSGMRRWLGPLAGFALGAGLAALFMNNGLAGALAGILLLAAVAFGLVLLLRLLFGQRQGHAPLRYAGATPAGSPPPREPVLAPPSRPLGGVAAPHSVAATAGERVATAPPLEFDAEQFLQHARTNFLHLQAAHDRRDLSAIRDFLTPELYRDIEADVRAAGPAGQKTDIVTLNAEVIDVTTEPRMYVVSVRFSGLIREETGAEAQAFNEVWHLEKPIDGRSGWLVSGIQQA